MPAPKENIIKQGKLGRRQQEKESTRRRSRSWERVEAAARKEQEEQWKNLKQSERTRTRRGLHYQIERLPPPPLPLLLLLQTCFRFRLQCPSEIVEEAAQIQQPLVRYIKLSTWQAIKRQQKQKQSKKQLKPSEEACSMISFWISNPRASEPLPPLHPFAGGHNFALKIHQIFPRDF